jgi:hypothetical protein
MNRVRRLGIERELELAAPVNAKRAFDSSQSQSGGPLLPRARSAACSAIR